MLFNDKNGGKRTAREIKKGRKKIRTKYISYLKKCKS